jgi:hypothetical protein
MRIKIWQVSGNVVGNFFVKRIACFGVLRSPRGAIESSQAIHRLDLSAHRDVFVPFGTTEYLSPRRLVFGRPHGT